MRNWTYPNREGRLVWKEVEKALTYNSRNVVFGDWLDLILNTLLSLTDNFKRKGIIGKLKENKLDGVYEERYLEIAKKYDKGTIGSRPIDYLYNAWGLLSKEVTETDKDILGGIYETMISFGEHGQHFTPEHITDFMAEMANGSERVYDPCCGSGRFLISALKRNPDAELFGADLDDRCAKMTVINLWLFGANAEIMHANSLSGEVWKVWKVFKEGWVYEIEPKKELPQEVLAKGQMRF